MKTAVLVLLTVVFLPMIACEVLVRIRWLVTSERAADR